MNITNLNICYKHEIILQLNINNDVTILAFTKSYCNIHIPLSVISTYYSVSAYIIYIY